MGGASFIHLPQEHHFSLFLEWGWGTIFNQISFEKNRSRYGMFLEWGWGTIFNQISFEKNRSRYGYEAGISYRTRYYLTLPRTSSPII